MGRSKLEFIICAVLLVCIFAVSLTLRIAIPWDHVFAGQWTKLTDNDAYYYMRLLDNLSHHFPLLGQFDTYSIFPAGKNLTGQPLFFIYFMGFFTWLFGGAVPSQQVVDMVGVFFPAVMGASLVFPVFFIGKAVFNKWAGLTAALFIALIPGEFLVRTLLGNTDIHVMEIFFSTLFMLFLILSVSAGKNITLSPWQQLNHRTLIKPAIYCVIAGLCLGIYIISWNGALFFVFISFAWLVAQLIINHLRGLPSGYLGPIGAIVYLTALLITLAGAVELMTCLSLAAALIASAILPLISWYLQRRKFNAIYYPLTVIVLAVLAVLAIYIVRPQMLNSMLNALAGFFIWRPESTIAESQPLLINQGAFTLALLWGNYTAGSIMALIALGIIIYQVFKKCTPEITILFVWSILTLLAALAMRRFAYYFAIDVALLSGYTGWLILKTAGLKETLELHTPPATGSSNKKKSTRRSASVKGVPLANTAIMALGVAAVALLAIYPNTGPLPGGDKPFFDVASKALYTPNDAWCESLDWLRNNTPEPFGDAQYYYDYYAKVPASTSSATTASYSVVCWWDYGYWVTRIGHRVPVSNPGSAQLGEQAMFMTQDVKEASKYNSTWNMKYVIVNDYLVDWTKGFNIVSSDALQPTSRYYEIYYRNQNGKLSPTLLYYPDYYKTLSVRLYCFDGKQYTPSETAVISWEEKTDSNGRPYKEITALKTSPIYEDVVKFVAAQKSGNWRIVGKDPNVSCVPLEESTGYKLAYGSSQKTKIGTADISQVKVFEYTKQ
ncbi:MAG: oligosaccharyl transferase, archaeosortase A system-associated [Chloroflexi bacterium]|nr:oligosaccharyl transferase, archaeosortase A system-associated [Chloroflexota bacterium]